MNILVVVCHPRANSLTSQIAVAFSEGATKAGHHIELLDLYKENFDPVLRIEDEPNDEKLENYSLEVQSEFKRLNNNDAVVMVFPLWWWSLPAMLKGWIDRVWNYGLMYGSKKHNVKKGLMIALAGATREQLLKRDYEAAINTNLNIGILDYCGVKDSEIMILKETNKITKEECLSYIQQAYDKGLSF
jgi:NAD(P)H dehydrogenase (quinone)